MGSVVIPGRSRSSFLSWIRKNLLSTPFNALLTLLVGVIAVMALVGAGRFLASADFSIIRVNLALFMVGGFPREELWRVGAALATFGVMAGLTAGLIRSGQALRAQEAGLLAPPPSRIGQIARRFWPIGVLVGVCLSLTETFGPVMTLAMAVALGVAGNLVGRAARPRIRRMLWLVVALLPIVAYLILSSSGLGWDKWGGFQLNIFLTFAGVFFAFPIGVLLALARRSDLPVVKGLAVTYIEVIRGVPLISLLLMGVFALGFFLPLELRPSGVTRVLVAITLFEAAYIAEVIRGGFQAVPTGQTEAAQSLGLSPFQTTRAIVMPQALRATIPAMVGQFISLFKDTSLVAVVGFADILAASGFANAQPGFNGQGLARVTLPFVALAFWAGCYTMSREARRLESRLGIGER